MRLPLSTEELRLGSAGHRKKVVTRAACVFLALSILLLIPIIAELSDSPTFTWPWVQ